MARAYISRGESIGSCQPTELWPTVLLPEIGAHQQSSFINRCKAVEMYVNGDTLSKIETNTSIAKNKITPLFRRCILIHPDGRIFGFRALIPNLNLNGYKRKADIKPKFNESQGGMSGVFEQLLTTHPDIEKKLTQFINKENTAQLNVHEKKIRAKDLHRIFLSMLIKKGFKDHQWPFNTKYKGFRTIQTYLNEILGMSFGKSVKNREEQVSVAHVPVGTGHERFLVFHDPYDLVQLDAYCIEAFFSTQFETPEGTTVDVQLDRIWHIALVETTSGAILSYKTVYRSEIGAEDVIDVLRKAVNPPTRIKLTIPGLMYPKNGGLPNEVFKECIGALWTSLMLDGALVHLSNAVHERARKHLGFCLNWGPVGHFERRPDIERYFASLSKEVFLRLPSTSGSNPFKGRAKNAEENAVIYKIRAEEVEQIVAVFTAQHNSTPNEGKSYNSPLEVIQQFLEAPNRNLILRKIPVKTGSTKILIPLIICATVRGSRATGRRPYVQYMGAKYTNPVLAQTPALIGQKLNLEFDENDVTYCMAYLPNGAELGILKALGHWGRSTHSLKTRKAINSLITKRVITVSVAQDPIQIYMNHLSTRRHKNKPGKVIKPSFATEATRVAKESGIPLKIKDKLDDVDTKFKTRLNQTTNSLIPKAMPDLNELLKKR